MIEHTGEPRPAQAQPTAANGDDWPAGKLPPLISASFEANQLARALSQWPKKSNSGTPWVRKKETEIREKERGRKREREGENSFQVREKLRQAERKGFEGRRRLSKGGAQIRRKGEGRERERERNCLVGPLGSHPFLSQFFEIQF